MKKIKNPYAGTAENLGYDGSFHASTRQLQFVLNSRSNLLLLPKREGREGFPFYAIRT